MGIVDSTRPLYQRKLALVLAGDNGAEEANDTNGEIEEEEEEEVVPTKAASRRVSTRSTRSNIAAAAAEFSADEEEAILEEEPVASEATEDDDSDEQPSVVVKEATPKPALTNHLYKPWAKLFANDFRVQAQPSKRVIDSLQLQGGVFIRTKSRKQHAKL